MSSPWAKIFTPEPINLECIMSEEAANKKKCLKMKRNSECNINKEEFCESFTSENICDTERDDFIARIIQREYDEEHNEMLRIKDKPNYTSTFLNFNNTSNNNQLDDFGSENDSDEEETEYVIEEENVQHSDKVISKYDIKLECSSSQLKHSECKVEDNNKLSNTLCDSLNSHSKCKRVKKERLYNKKEAIATTNPYLDFCTRLHLYKSINNQLLERVNGAINIDHEAEVLFSSYPYKLLKECTIKMYKTGFATLKNNEVYITGEKYFISRIEKPFVKRTIHFWADIYPSFCGVSNTGDPIYFEGHVRLMSLIEENHRPVKKLKYVEVQADKYKLAYNQVIKTLKDRCNKGILIHVDLSEYRIFQFKKQHYFIDVSQCDKQTGTNHFDFLRRDCENVSDFFSRIGVPNVKSPQTLFMETTGFDYYNRVLSDFPKKVTK